MIFIIHLTKFKINIASIIIDLILDNSNLQSVNYFNKLNIENVNKTCFFFKLKIKSD